MNFIKLKDRWMRGLPYVGNKNQKADQIIDILPEGKRLIDVFGGGGSISLHAISAGKWDEVIYNDINTSIVNLLKALITNNPKIDLKRFAVPNRETFFRYKKQEKISIEREIVLTCWSFSNDRCSFIFGKNNEFKILISQALMYGNTGTEYDFLYDRCKSSTITETYQKYHKVKKEILAKGLRYSRRLQRLEQFQALEQLERLSFKSCDYRSLKLSTDDIIYLDPPYIGTGNQYGGFNHERFHKWYSSLPNSEIYISEYTQLPNTEIVADMGVKHSFTATGKRKHELLLKVIS
ncbi:DNA adenine methylase [Lactobacillus colini]|uniref:DNA adenine methylase n=1 Tax=Lactobacillus colini TaxID=1819254 RepID=UPI00315B371C